MRLLKLTVLVPLMSLVGLAAAQPYQHETHMELYAGGASDSYSAYNTLAPQSRQAMDPFAGWAKGTAYMGYGTNSVKASIGNTDVTPFLQSQVSNRWGDDVTIDAPGLTGTEGLFTASVAIFCDSNFSLTGAYANDPDSSVFGFWNSWIGTSADNGDTWQTGEWSGLWRKNFASPGQMIYEGDTLNAVQWDVSLPFIYGQTFRLGGFLEAVVIAENPNQGAGSISASLDFTPASRWNGISGIYDAESNEVFGATLVSASGTNYMTAVPEPTAMFGLGLGLAAILRRRRKA